MKIRQILTKINLIAIIIVMLSLQAYSFSSNSSQKKHDFIVNSGSYFLSSSGFKSSVVVGNAIIDTNSSSFKGNIGFVRTLPYLNGEQCQINSECLGGFCCTNICQGTSCPVAEATGAAVAGASGGGGGAITKIEDFSFDIELIKALLRAEWSKDEVHRHMSHAIRSRQNRR